MLFTQSWGWIGPCLCFCVLVMFLWQSECPTHARNSLVQLGVDDADNSNAHTANANLRKVVIETAVLIDPVQGSEALQQLKDELAPLVPKEWGLLDHPFMFCAGFMTTPGEAWMVARTRFNSGSCFVQYNMSWDFNSDSLEGLRISKWAHLPLPAASPEDPRVFRLSDAMMLQFQAFERQGGPFHLFFSSLKGEKTTPLSIEGRTPQPFEKNWAPVVKGTKLFYVYCVDPLVVLQCHTTSGVCVPEFKQVESLSVPFDTSKTVVRGGSPFVPLHEGQEEYYISFMHATTHKWQFWNSVVGYSPYPHRIYFCVLGTNPWRVVYISRALPFGNTMQRYGFAPTMVLDPVSIVSFDREADTILLSVSIDDRFCGLVKVRNARAVAMEVIQSEAATAAIRKRGPGYWDEHVKADMARLAMHWSLNNDYNDDDDGGLAKGDKPDNMYKPLKPVLRS